MTDFSCPHLLRASLSSVKRSATQLKDAGCCLTSAFVRFEVGCLLGVLDAVVARLHRLIPQADAESQRRAAVREGRAA